MFILPKVNKNEVKEFIEDQQKLSSSDPVPYKSYAFIQPLLILYLLKQNKNDCYIPNKGGDFFILGASAKQLNINDTDRDLIYSSYKRCKKREKILVIPMSVIRGHANMIIINYHRNEIERFEPHGDRTGHWKVDSGAIDKSIEKSLVNKLNDKITEDNKKNNEDEKLFTYISPSKLCPNKKGFQAYEGMSIMETNKNNVYIKDPGGFCMAWSYFYGFLRLKFPKIAGNELIDKTFEIVSKDPLKLRKFIRGQMLFLSSIFDDVGEKDLLIKLVETKNNDYNELGRISNKIKNYVNDEFEKFMD